MNRLAAWLRPSRRKATVQEWDNLSVEERFRLTADIGLSEPEMGWAIHHGAGSGELSVIMARLAKRGVTCSLGVLRDMQRVCNLCKEHARCRVWLARAEPNAMFPDYCPNAITLASLRQGAYGQGGQHAGKVKQ
ncbi:MAG TPA: DUF6455 family protein [Ferrovibrio sp.]|uniref:DUF6455 family protein n=1 Tax=Ferrovibrio sp. TaxID=1917215 RepID=UPI002ED0F9EC